MPKSVLIKSSTLIINSLVSSSTSSVSLYWYQLIYKYVKKDPDLFLSTLYNLLVVIEYSQYDENKDIQQLSSEMYNDLFDPPSYIYTQIGTNYLQGYMKVLDTDNNIHIYNAIQTINSHFKSHDYPEFLVNLLEVALAYIQKTRDLLWSKDRIHYCHMLINIIHYLNSNNSTIPSIITESLFRETLKGPQEYRNTIYSSWKDIVLISDVNLPFLSSFISIITGIAEQQTFVVEWMKYIYPLRCVSISIHNLLSLSINEIISTTYKQDLFDFEDAVTILSNKINVIECTDLKTIIHDIKIHVHDFILKNNLIRSDYFSL
ncbi:hypothetical protein WA158_005034 [Blastocystis sp. Blastoise]